MPHTYNSGVAARLAGVRGRRVALTVVEYGSVRGVIREVVNGLVLVDTRGDDTEQDRPLQVSIAHVTTLRVTD